MQPRYLTSNTVRSLLQLQPYLVPLVRENQPVVHHKSHKKLHYTIVFVATLLLCSGVGLDGMKGFTKYVRSLRWTPIPVGVGIAVIALQRFKHINRREEERLRAGNELCLARPWEVQAYKMLPLRHLSRALGWVNDLYIPVWCRRAVLSTYATTFGCDMSEAEQEDITQYKSLSSLFRRSIKPSVRPIDERAAVTSPVDGTVLSAGPVTCGTLHQIKGVQYSMRQFLGPNVWSEDPIIPYNRDNDECYHESCLENPSKSELYQVVIYLAPGDYHRFHSPANWSVMMRRHYPGELFSVSPNFASWLPGLFVLNERVVYVGNWKEGFCSMTAVGATNVGTIKVFKDEKLKTNNPRWKEGEYFDHWFKEDFSLKKGELFGEFNLGSTVVVLVEVPKDGCRVECEQGTKVKMGQALITLKNDAHHDTKRNC